MIIPQLSDDSLAFITDDREWKVGQENGLVDDGKYGSLEGDKSF